MTKAKTDKRREHFIALAIAFIIAVTAGIMAVRGFPMELENMTADGLYQNADVIPDDIKIIAIDEKTLKNLGPYTDWDRSEFAKLLEILNKDSESAPKVIGIDFVFSGSEQSEADAQLVRACNGHDNIVLASTVTFDHYISQDDAGEYYGTIYISGEGLPYKELAQVTEQGFTNAIFDKDGIIRKIYTQIQSNGRIYDSFAYKIASKVGEVKSYPSSVEIVYVSKPGEIEKISMSDVLDGTVPAEYFEDCIVLVGAYAEGLMDSYRVPVDYSKEMYGVEIQANAIHAFLHDDMVYPVNAVL